MDTQKIFTMFETKKIHEPPESVPLAKRVAIGTIAGMIATVLVHPYDLIKVRKMTFPGHQTARSMARRILRCEGYLAFYSGLSAGLLRQGTNTSTRLAVYNALYDDSCKETDPNAPPTEVQKVLLGTVAGLAGGFLGSPTEVVLVRMLAASAPRAYNYDPDLQKLIANRYRNCFDGIRRIVVEEGVLTLWRGGTLTLSRNAALTLSQVGGYSMIRDKLISLNMDEGYSLHVLTTIVTSLVSTVLTLPIDYIKTRYQIKTGGVTIPGIFNAVRQKQGILGLWSRNLFMPYYSRLLFHSMVSFFVSENLLKSHFDGRRP